MQEGTRGVPGGEGLCAGAQGWQPCPRPLTQHRHRRCGAGNSRCRQRAGSCQARLPDPHRLRGQTVAVPCSVWGQAGKTPQHSAGWGCGDRLSTLLGTSRVAGDTERLGCHPSCLPAAPSAKAVHSQHRPFLQGSDRPSLQCLHPPASDVPGRTPTHRPRAQGACTHRWGGGIMILSGPAEWVP